MLGTTRDLKLNLWGSGGEKCSVTIQCGVLKRQRQNWKIPNLILFQFLTIVLRKGRTGKDNLPQKSWNPLYFGHGPLPPSGYATVGRIQLPTTAKQSLSTFIQHWLKDGKTSYYRAMVPDVQLTLAHQWQPNKTLRRLRTTHWPGLKVLRCYNQP